MTATIDPNDLTGTRTALRDVLHRAAVTVRGLYENRRFSVETKDDNTPLTTADLAANEILRAGLREIDPDAGWLSEENEDTDARLKCERVWIVDPIDGTREFVDRTGGYSISVGLAINGRADLGGVALPQENIIVVGARGAGIEVWRYAADGSDGFERIPGALIADETAPDLKDARILVSVSESKRGAYASVADELKLQPTGSIARKLALVAMGRADLVVSLYPKNEWDICGGAALIECQPNAGMIELEHGQGQRYNRANPATIGLAAGPAGLVRQFEQYSKMKKLVLRHNYD